MNLSRSLVVTYSVTVAALALAPAGIQLGAQDHVGQYEQADIEYGMRLYGENCVSCHGADGDGIVGVNLRSGQFSRASSDFELTRLIRAGISDTAMPPGDYNVSELAGLVAYLRTMGELDPSDVTVGDTGRGQTIFAGKGDCTRCHRVGDSGSRVAPNLSDIGAIRTAAALERSLIDPTGSMLPTNRPVQAVTRGGTRITGRRLNEDSFTVQLIDQDERLRSLEKADLREYTVLTTSSMPSYDDTLTAKERADVLAYLLSLKGVN